MPRNFLQLHDYSCIPAAWAKKRGYVTAKAARLDTYRAANSLLRLAVDGRIVLSIKPPGYFDKYGLVLARPLFGTVLFAMACAYVRITVRAMCGWASFGLPSFLALPRSTYGWL